MCERGLLNFAWRPVRGLCCNEEFENALAEIRHDAHHPKAGTLWTVMLALAAGECRRNNTGLRAARASSSSAGISRARSSASSSSEQVRIGLVLRKQAEASAGVSTRLCRQPPRAARQDPPVRPSAKRVEADPRPSLDRSEGSPERGCQPGLKVWGRPNEARGGSLACTHAFCSRGACTARVCDPGLGLAGGPAPPCCSAYLLARRPAAGASDRLA